MTEQNGTEHKGGVCTHRNNGQGHCFHSSAPPFRLITGTTLVFPSVCCFCSPPWMHFDIYMDNRVSDEEVVAAQMLHGPRVTVSKQPQRGPQLHVPGR